MDFASLHELLRSTYDEMMPLCAQMTGIAKGIAGLGALFYIALRVWASIARAEAIDVFPLLRPFVLGFCIMFFPTVVLGTMNAVLSPVVQGTESMVHQQETNLAELTAKRNRLQEEAYLRNPEMVHDLMELLFHAAGLIIDTLRTFILIVLSILGPIVFGIAVWDGLAGSLTAWFSRYISVYLWLPVSSILTALLTKIQVLMVQKDIEALSDPNYLPDAGTWYYIVFFLIGIVGYFCVPTVAGWIIEAGGGIGSYGRNVNQAAQRGAQSAYTGGRYAAAGAGSVIGNVGGRIKGALLKGK